jgi:hypothetical protein
MPEDEPKLPYEIDHKKAEQDTEFFESVRDPGIRRIRPDRHSIANNMRHKRQCGKRSSSWLDIDVTRTTLKDNAHLASLKVLLIFYPRSSVRKISKPDFSVRSNNSPFFFPAQPASGTVWHSCPGR